MTDQDSNQPTEGVDDDSTASTEGKVDETKPDEGVENQSEGGSQDHQDETVEVGGEKLTKDQLAELVSKGKDYTQKTQALADEKKQWEEQKEKEAEANLPPEEKAKLETDKEYVQKLIGDKYVSKDEIKRMKRDEALDAEHDRLAKLYNGKDGRPKFDKKEMLDYAVTNGIFNPEAAYRNKYHDQLQDWAIKQARKGPKGTYTEKGMARGGRPAPKEPAKDWNDAENRMESDLASKSEE